MFARGVKHFYVDELAKLNSGEVVIPLMWIKWKGEVFAECLDVICVEVSSNQPDI